MRLMNVKVALAAVAVPVMATIKNLSNSIRTFKDRHGKDIHIHPNQERSFPMHPGHVPMLQKEAGKPNPKIELIATPIEGDEILPTTPRTMQSRAPTAARQDFRDPAQTLGRPRPLVAKLSDNDPKREGAGPDFSDQSRKPPPVEEPVRAADPGPSRYEGLEDDKLPGTMRLDGEQEADPVEKEPEPARERRETAREPRERTRRKKR